MKTYRLVTTCWDKGFPKPYLDSNDFVFLTSSEVEKHIKNIVEDELTVLNHLDTDTPRELVSVKDSDGNIISYAYPFRADFNGEHTCIVRFWDGDDYFNVTAYDIYECGEYDGYYTYRKFQIYPNKKKTLFIVKNSIGDIVATKRTLQNSLKCIDEWHLNKELKRYGVICYSVHDKVIASSDFFDSYDEALKFLILDSRNTYEEEKLSASGEVVLEQNEATAKLSSCEDEYVWTWEIVH